MIGLFSNQSFLFLIAINVVAALGMNIVYLSGQLNLGQAGFLAIGAYATAFTDTALHWPLPASLAAGAIAAGVIAWPVALGANRVRGIYLIMGTLAAGELIRIVIGNLEFLGGLQGFSGITPVTLPEVSVTLVMMLVGTVALVASPLGLQMRAIFDDEEAAAAAGVATQRVKVVAVVLSAAVVAVAGGLMAKWLLFIAPRDFGIDTSFQIALFTLIGGVHSVLGAVAGAVLITYLLEALKQIGQMKSLPAWAQLVGPWRLVIYGLLVMLLMRLRSEGLVSRQWELFLASLWRRLGDRRGPARANSPVRGNGVSRWPENATKDAAAGALLGGPLLELTDLSYAFDGLQALHDVSLSIYPGEILALIGANGAGKTTLINVVCGRYPFQKGSIRLLGKDLTILRPDQRTRAGISRTFQEVRAFSHLTVEEHLRLGQLAGGARQAPSLEQVLALIGLESRRQALPASLNLAEQRRLEIGRVLASSPCVAFLDEPSVGMNEAERADLAGLIRQVCAQGTSVVLVDHNLDLALGAAHRVAVLDFGALLTVGLPGQVLNNPQVWTAYLGNLEAAT